MAVNFNDTFTDTDLVLLSAHTSDSGGSWIQAIGNSPQIFSTAISGQSMAGPGPGGAYSVWRTSVIAPSADAKVPIVAYNFGGVVAFAGAAVRLTGSGTSTRGYVGIYNPTSGHIEIWKLDNNGQLTGSPLASSATFSWPSATSYSGELKAEGSLITFTLNGVTISVTDTSIATAGYAGLIFSANQGNGIFFNSLSLEDINTAATAVTLIGPTSGNVGVASTNFTVGANGAITGTVTVTPSDSGGGGTFTPTSVNISSGTPTATFTYTPATNGVKVISVTNNGGLTNPASINYTAAAAGAPTAGTASLSSATVTTLNVTCTAASGGTAPLTYQWHRSTTANFTPGAGTVVSGATSLTLADSTGLSQDTPYYYKLRVTDATSLTADSNQIAGSLRLPDLNLGGLGDSITNQYGLTAGQGPLEQAAVQLRVMGGYRNVTVVNRGINGASTADWLSGSTNLNNAKTAFAAGGVTHVHIMLGANDAAAGTLRSAAAYKTNLQNIITDLVGAGYKVILSYPTYIPAGANSNATTAAGVALAQAYQAEIDSLINNTTILRGDTKSFNAYMDNLAAWYQADMTHPNVTGAQALGSMWSRAMYEAIYQNSAPALTTRTASITLGGTSGAYANLTGVSVDFYDEATGLTTTARYQSSTETTDASGVLSFSVSTTLASGAQGSVVIKQYSSGLHYNGLMTVT